MKVRWIFPFTEEEKKKYKELVPERMWDNPFLQRMFYLNPELFERLAKAKEKVKEVV